MEIITGCSATVDVDSNVHFSLMLSSFLPPNLTLTEHKDLVISRQRDTSTEREREKLSDSINTNL